MVLNVWASWCEPCREEMPLLQKTHEQIASQGGHGARASTRRTRSSKALEFLDGGQGDVPEPARPRPRRTGASSASPAIPETFLIDRKGRVAAMQRFPVTQAWLDKHLPKLLAEKA